METHFNPRTPPEVVRILEECRISRNERRPGRRIRVRYGHTRGPKVGLDWLEEYDVEGTIGRSTGRIKVPLMIHNSRSTGGQAIMDDCIVRIIDTKTHKVLYSHPKYRHPKFTVRVSGPSANPFPPTCRSEMPAVVMADGKLHASFPSRRAAEAWVKKMSL